MTPDDRGAVEAALRVGSAVVVVSSDPAWGRALAGMEGSVALLTEGDRELAEAMGAELFPGRDLVIVEPPASS